MAQLDRPDRPVEHGRPQVGLEGGADELEAEPGDADEKQAGEHVGQRGPCTAPMPPAPSREAKRGTMWLPVAVAMPMPAKLPITSANTESFCAAKMPVAPGSRPTRRSTGPTNSRPMHVEQQDGGDEAEGGDGDPALAPVPSSTSRRTLGGTSGRPPARARCGRSLRASLCSAAAAWRAVLKPWHGARQVRAARGHERSRPQRLLPLPLAGRAPG